MAKSLDDIFNSDTFGLLSAKEVNPNVAKTDEDRLIDAFEDINQFYDKNGREPERSSMAEYALLSRLNGFKNNIRHKELLKPFDRFNLLGNLEQPPKTIDDILASENFKNLIPQSDSSLFDFKNIPKPGSRAEAEYVAQRKAIADKDFEKYDMLFKQVHKELKTGQRKLLQFDNAEKNLKEGNFYLVDGLLCYLEISKAEEVLKENKSGARKRLEGRTLTIFENGTKSNLLFRSLAKAIQKNGKMITNTNEAVEAQLIQNTGATNNALESQTGWIYILKTKSTSPELTTIKNLYKIGFSTTTVEERIKNTKKEATYLFDEVELIASYRCHNINVKALENLLHRFFAAQCVNLSVYIKQNTEFFPREWFSLPLPVIDEAINLLLNGTIVNYRYDDDAQRILLK